MRLANLMKFAELFQILQTSSKSYALLSALVFILLLRNPLFAFGQSGGAANQPPVTINDVSVTALNSGATKAVFTVSLSRPSAQVVTVKYSTTDNTARAGVDYVASSGTLSFAPGETDKPVSIPINPQTVNQPTKTFSVNLANPVNATLGKAEGIGTILSGAPAPSISISDASVTALNSGKAVFTVSLSRPSVQVVTADYATADGTARAGVDYLASSGTLSFSPGQTTRSVVVVVNPQTSNQSAKSFYINLTNLVNVTPGNVRGTGTILSVLTAVPPPTISISDSSVLEGNVGTTNAAFLVSLSAPSEQTVTVDFATADGTATSGEDYVAVSGTLSFNSGEINKSISVQVIGDTVSEPDEIFFVVVSKPTNATISRGQAVGKIIDDDRIPNTPPTISAIADLTINENSASPVVTFTIGDKETPVAELQVGATSSNASLVPVGNVVFGGSGASRNLMIAPAANQVGTAVITVIVFDANGGTATTTFSVTVLSSDQVDASPGAILWELDLGEKSSGWDPNAVAVASDGTVYVVAAKKLYSIAPTGSLKWTLQISNSNISATPVVGSDGTIYAGYLVAVNPDGTKKWEYQTGYTGRTAPAIDRDGTIYVSAFTTLAALSSGRGTVKWAVDVGGGPANPVIGLDGTIYLGLCLAASGGYKFFAFDRTGAKKWEYPVVSQCCFAPAIATDGTIYSPASYLFSFSSSGSNLWKQARSFGGTAMDVSLGEDETVYYGEGFNTLAALDGTGGLKWQSPRYSFFFAPPAVGRRGIYLAPQSADRQSPTGVSHSLVALDFSGKVQWQTQLGGNHAAGPPVLAENGIIYVATDFGKVYAIQSADKPARSSWPMLGRNPQHTSRIDPEPPLITVQPVGNDVINGTDLALQSEAFGIPTPMFQWMLDGKPISGATNRVIRFTNVQTNNSGSYSVRAFNDYGFALSQPAVVNVKYIPRFTVTARSDGNGSVDLNPRQTNYLDGMSVKATAVAFPGHRFTGWTGDVGGTNNPISLTVSKDVAFEAHFTPVWTLSVRADEGGAVVVDPNAKEYLDASTVKVTAVSRDGFAFIGWGGDISGTTNPASLVMNGNKSVTAEFVSTVLNIVTSGLGTVAKSPDKNFYMIGDTVTILATAGRWHEFTRWGDGTTNNPRVVTIGKTNSYAAIFSPTQALETLIFSGVSRLAPIGTPVIFINDQFVTTAVLTNAQSARIEMKTSFSAGQIYYTLDGSKPTFLSDTYVEPFRLTKSSTIRAVAYNADFTKASETDPIELSILPVYSVATPSVGGGRAIVEPSRASYLKGESVKITAVPDPGWAFIYWLGDGSGTNSTLQVKVNQNLIVQPVFATSLRTTSTGSGQIRRKPDQIFYPFGSVVRLTAIPEDGNYFAAWGDAARGRTNPLSFAVTNADTGISALFAPLNVDQVTFVVFENGFGTVSVSPGTNVFTKGQTVTLTAVPEPGQRFTGWSGDASGSQNPLSITLNPSKRVTADFTRRPTLTIQQGLPGPMADGFKMLLSGEVGTAYAIEASSDLLNWEPLTVVTNLFSTMPMIDPMSTNFPNRWYRVVFK